MCDQQSEPWTQHQTSMSSWAPIGQDAQQPGSQHQVSSSSSWDQQYTSAAARKQQFHSAVQKQNYTPSPQEQQNHLTSETSYKKHSTSRRWTLGSTQTLQAGRAWQQGLDPQRKQNTWNSNTFSSSNWCNMILWGLSRSTQQTTLRKSSPSTSQHRRSSGISTMLGSQPSITSNSSNQQQFHCSKWVNVRTRVQRANNMRSVHAHRHTVHEAMVLTMVSNIDYNMDIFVLHLCVFQHDLLSVPTWLWMCMTTWLS